MRERPTLENFKGFWEALIKEFLHIKCAVHYNGKVIAKGTPSNIKDKYSNDRLILTYKDIEQVKRILDAKNIEYEISCDMIKIPINSTMESIDLIQDSKEFITSFEVIKGTMDDAFINITGNEMRQW